MESKVPKPAGNSHERCLYHVWSRRSMRATASRANMKVDEFAGILLDPQAQVIDAVFYPWDTPLGYRAEFEYHNRWYWYSVSSALQAVSPAEVAVAITSPTRRIQRCGADKSGHGFEATVRSGDRCYRFGHGDNRMWVRWAKVTRAA